jgi:putative flippase GtrA
LEQDLNIGQTDDRQQAPEALLSAPFALVIRVHNAELPVAQRIKQAAAGFSPLVIVDDCSKVEFCLATQVLSEIPGSIMLQMRGKPNRGRALKAGLRALKTSGYAFQAVVTLDCGGLNTPFALQTICEALQNHPRSLIIGILTEEAYPGRLRTIGRNITRWVARRILKLNIEEGMTFLRGIPAEFLEGLLENSHEHERYLSGMIYYARKIGVEVIFQPVTPPVGYVPRPNPLEDYFTFFRYALVSLLTTLVDYAVFLAVHSLVKDLLASVYAARVVSVIINYLLVREGVFYSGKRIIDTLPRYLALVAFSGWVAARLMDMGMRRFGLDLVLAKMLAEMTLYLFNFFMMRWFVFRNWRR